MLAPENGMTVGRVEYAPDYGRWQREAFGGRIPGPMEVDPRDVPRGVAHIAGQSPIDRAAALESGDNTFVRKRSDPIVRHPLNDPWEQWHRPPLTAVNDNDRKPVMIGLTGKRNVGKSTFANVLEEEFGWNKVHAFESGKIAAEAYFRSILRHLSDGDDVARRMVWGDLKDKPSPHLPGSAEPRYYLERVGHFHGDDLGTEWTLALELRAAIAMHPHAPIVVESVVYESPWFREQGGKVVRLVRPGFDGPVGVKSDAVQAELAADFEFVCSSPGEVEAAARSLHHQLRRAA